MNKEKIRGGVEVGFPGAVVEPGAFVEAGGPPPPPPAPTCASQHEV